MIFLVDGKVFVMVWEMYKRVVEIRTATVVYLGSGATEALEGVLSQYQSKGLRRVGVITGRSSYKDSGAWQRVLPLLEGMFEFAHFDGVRPNPSTETLDEAAGFFRQFRPQLFLAIGGGSVIDSAKAVSALVMTEDRRAEHLYRHQWDPEEAVPLVAVNLTHGTGSEVDRYAVATIKGTPYKGGIAHRCLYPEYSVDDPSLMVTLSEEQTRYTSIDALAHLIEAATTTRASPFTINLAREGIEKIARWLPLALMAPEDIEARYYLLYASMLGGLAIDSGVVHLTHPMEHLLSAKNPSLPHGLGLATLMPSVVEVIYPSVSEVLDEVLAPLVGPPGGASNRAQYYRDALRQWFKEIGFRESLRDYGFSEEMVPVMARELFEYYGRGSINLAPVKATNEVIEKIYRDSINYSFKE